MRTPAEYRLLADEYFRDAEKITAKRRIELLEMANSCRRLADQGDLRAAQSRLLGAKK
jgi:hypothetical protein